MGRKEMMAAAGWGEGAFSNSFPSTVTTLYSSEETHRRLLSGQRERRRRNLRAFVPFGRETKEWKTGDVRICRRKLKSASRLPVAREAREARKWTYLHLLRDSEQTPDVLPSLPFLLDLLPPLSSSEESWQKRSLVVPVSTLGSHHLDDLIPDLVGYP